MACGAHVTLEFLASYVLVPACSCRKDLSKASMPVSLVTNMVSKTRVEERRTSARCVFRKLIMRAVLCVPWCDCVPAAPYSNPRRFRFSWDKSSHRGNSSQLMYAEIDTTVGILSATFAWTPKSQKVLLLPIRSWAAIKRMKLSSLSSDMSNLRFSDGCKSAHV